ncbi:hypothetical protein GmRootV213_25170 [Variovorax sp. V213]
MQRVAAPGSGALWPDSVPASGSVPSNRRAPRATEEGTAASGFPDHAGPKANAVPSASASIIIESLGFAKRAGRYRMLMVRATLGTPLLSSANSM